MKPRIRAAVKAGKPPLMFILEDPSHTEWTRWDIRLAKAFEIHEDLLVGGIPVYIDRSERVEFDLKSYISKSRAVLDRAEDKARNSKKKNYGKMWYVVPRTTDGGPLPTLEEFLESRKNDAMDEDGGGAGGLSSQWGEAMMTQRRLESEGEGP